MRTPHAGGNRQLQLAVVHANRTRPLGQPRPGNFLPGQQCLGVAYTVGDAEVLQDAVQQRPDGARLPIGDRHSWQRSRASSRYTNLVHVDSSIRS